MTQHPHTAIGRLLARLTPLDTEERIDCILNDLRETGMGDLDLSRHSTMPIQIALHGVFAAGPDIATACARWIEAAAPHARIEELIATVNMRSEARAAVH